LTLAEIRLSLSQKGIRGNPVALFSTSPRQFKKLLHAQEQDREEITQARANIGVTIERKQFPCLGQRVPSVYPSDVVVMDNLPAHIKSAASSQ